MRRVKAYHILGKMLEDATPEQAEAISIAQNDIEFVYLMPKDMVAVVRCKDCMHMEFTPVKNRYCRAWGRIQTMGDDGFCNFGERKDGDGNG